MSVAVTETWNLRLIRRTDRVSRHVLVFGHGKESGDRHKLTSNKRVHFYVPEEHTFNLDREVFNDAFKGDLAGHEVFGRGESFDDYDLTKAAHAHPGHSNRNRTIYTYEMLSDFVEHSDNMAEAQLPAAHGLGRGVSCDIVSIRHRKVSDGIRLSAVLQEGILAGYDVVHCFFCRAKQYGKSPGARPARRG